MKNIKIRYFALLKEKRGLAEEELKVDISTYKDLYEELSKKYVFTLPVEMIQVAVDDEFVAMNDLIKDKARVVFIPPVAGG
jgi:molybdopterin synthase sulfur carrier subunit